MGVSSAGTLAGQVEHLLGVVGRDEAGAGEHRLAATHRVEVVVVQGEEHDRQVPLEVLLLIDGEQAEAAPEVEFAMAAAEVDLVATRLDGS